MKWTSFLLLTTLMISAKFHDSSQALVNPGFEVQGNKGRPPAGWHALWNPRGGVVAGVARTGEHSLYLRLSGRKESAAFYQGVPISSRKGRTHRVTAYVRTLDLRGEAHLFVYRYPPPFKKPFVSRRLSGTNEWTKLVLDVPDKPKGNSLQVRLLVNGTWGEAWFDDVSVAVAEGTE